MTQELAKIIKRLRETHKLYEDSCKEISPNSNAYKTTADEHSYLSANLRYMLVEHGLSTINALVQLVGEMYDEHIMTIEDLAAVKCGYGSDEYFKMIAKRKNTKTAHIAALATLGITVEGV